METILSRYTPEDIRELFGKYYPDIIFTVHGDATAGIQLTPIYDEHDVQQCKSRFVGLGFDLVEDKHLTNQQKTEYDFHIFFTNIKRLSDAERELVTGKVLQTFDEADVKCTGAIIATKKTGGFVSSYIETEDMTNALKGFCFNVKLIKRNTDETKFIAQWGIK